MAKDLIINTVTKELHHKQFITGSCNVDSGGAGIASRIDIGRYLEKPERALRVFLFTSMSMLTKLREAKHDLCGHCFSSKVNHDSVINERNRTR
jgi:hypothetical protein